MTKRNKNSNKHTTLQKDVAETGGGIGCFFCRGRLITKLRHCGFGGVPTCSARPCYVHRDRW